MTLAQIYRLALRQLDEDPADIEEFRDLFAVYVNQGYQIAVEQYVKPKETIPLRTDENGDVYMDGMGIARVISVRDAAGNSVYTEMSEDGMMLRTGRKNADLSSVCVVSYPELENDTDEPNLPKAAHASLADYICYKYLSTGNMAKQSRAQHFRNEFYTQMQRVKPQGSGSVTGFKNLYAATDTRWTR